MKKSTQSGFPKMDEIALQKSPRRPLNEISELKTSKSVDGHPVKRICDLDFYLFT